ncbi:Mariner Mos1 transposase [Eumeta japonica]|uniref:Mariner Mos1 transposase n=1 Tax=Eumeta variegata TaxID=151549 RepID=A0A4C1WEP3_EUMVA|nr:Mariner Mos1 transposase [Eumeta japonica]
MSQVYKSLHGHLEVRKLCIRWIPHNLTEAQKLRRVNWCCEMMLRFAGGYSNSVYDVVTGDESWIYCYDPETKRRFAQLRDDRRAEIKWFAISSPIRYCKTELFPAQFITNEAPTDGHNTFFF